MRLQWERRNPQVALRALAPNLPRISQNLWALWQKMYRLWSTIELWVLIENGQCLGKKSWYLQYYCFSEHQYVGSTHPLVLSKAETWGAIWLSQGLGNIRSNLPGGDNTQTCKWNLKLSAGHGNQWGNPKINLVWGRCFARRDSYFTFFFRICTV
jgi:hypothetical protein